MQVYINLVLFTPFKYTKIKLYSAMAHVIQQNLSFLQVCMTHQKYNQFTNIRQMLPNEEDFQLLVDTKDYLNLQARCHQLELSHQKLDEQNKILANKMFELKEENSNLQKKVTALTDDIRYLSQKGIQMSKSLMSLDEESQSLRLSNAQRQLDLGKKLQTVLVSKEQSEKKLIQQMGEIRKTKEELKQKSVQLQKILTVEKLSRHIQVSPNLKQVCVMGDLTSTQIEETMNANKSLKQKQSDLQRNQAKVLQELNQKNLQLNKIKKQIQTLKTTMKVQIDQAAKSSAMSSDQIQKMKRQLTKNQQKLKYLQNASACLGEQKQHLMKATQMLKMQNQIICQQRAMLQQQINELQKMIMVHVSKIKQKEDQCCDLTSHLKLYEQQLKMSESKMSELTKKNSDLIDQTRSLSRQIADLRNFQSSKLQELDALKSELCRKDKYCSQLCCEIQQLRAIHSRMNSDMNNLKSSLDCSIGQSTQKVYMLEMLEKEKNMLIKQIQSHKNTMDDLRNNLTRSYEQIQKLRSEIQYRQNKSKKQQQKINVQESIIEQHKNSVQSMKKFIQQNLNRNLVENSNVTSQIEKQKAQEFKQKNAILNSQISMLSQKYGQTVEIIQKLKLENNRLAIGIRQFEQRLSLQSAKIVQYEQITKNLKLSKQQSVEQLLNKVVCLQTQIKRSNDLLESSRKLQREYEEIIESMQSQKKKNISPAKNKKQQKDQLEEVKSAIFDYFLELACNLNEVGSLDESDIAGIIQQNKQIVVKQITEACEIFTQGKKIKAEK